MRDARIQIYDVAGRQVSSISLGDLFPGESRVQWDGLSLNETRVPAGIYLYRLEHADGTSEVKKAVRLPK